MERKREEKKQDRKQEMGEENPSENPGNLGAGDPVTLELCRAYRTVLENQIQGLTGDLKKVDERTWQILAGIIVTIALTLLSIAINFI